MSIRDFSWKAMLVGCLVIVITWSLFLLVAVPVETLVTNAFLGEPWTDPEKFDVDKLLDDQLTLFRWSTLTITLVGVVVCCGLGGYVTAGIAKLHRQLHAVLVVFTLALADGVYAFSVSDSSLFRFSQVTAIGGLAALLGSRMAIRAQRAKSAVDDSPG